MNVIINLKNVIYLEKYSQNHFYVHYLCTNGGFDESNRNTEKNGVIIGKSVARKVSVKIFVKFR